MEPGSYVTLITPFTSDGGIDWPAFDKLVDWHVRSGSKGVFTPCLSSEMFELAPAERLELARRARARAPSGVRVVACGTYGGAIAEQAKFVNALAPLCDAVVVNTACVAAEDEPDSVWQERVQELLDSTGVAPLGLYECPVPYKRLLTPEIMRWCSDSGRFLFLKDTCCRTDGLKAKLEACQPGQTLKLFNANVETLAASCALGGAGFSGIGANFYPHLHAFLCAEAARPGGGDAYKVGRVQDFLSLAEATVCVNYPASAKAYLELYAAEVGAAPLLSRRCRKAVGDFAEHQLVALAAMYRTQRELAKSVGIEEVNPVSGERVS